MGGEEVTEPPKQDEKPLDWHIFDESFAYYLYLGMTYDLYWYGDVWLVKAYRDAHEMHRDEMNQQLWLNGVYVYNAVATVVANIHLDGKNHTPVPYLKEPIRIRPYTEEELQAKAEKDADDVIRYLDEWAKAFNEEKQDAERN